MANTLQLLFLFCVLSVAVRSDSSTAAEKKLRSLDIDEIIDKLEEFDLNADGQLSEVEVELQPDVQIYLDRYDQLLKEADEDSDDDEEETKKTPQSEKEKKSSKQNNNHPSNPQKTKSEKSVERNSEKNSPTPAAPAQDADDDDDGVEIEVVEELEIVEDDEAGLTLTSPLVVAGLVGALTILAYALWSLSRSSQPVKEKQFQGESHMQRREAWLNRVSGSPQQREPEAANRNRTHAPDKIAASKHSARVGLGDRSSGQSEATKNAPSEASKHTQAGDTNNAQTQDKSNGNAGDRNSKGGMKQKPVSASAANPSLVSDTRRVDRASPTSKSVNLNNSSQPSDGSVEKVVQVPVPCRVDRDVSGVTVQRTIELSEETVIKSDRADESENLQENGRSPASSAETSAPDVSALKAKARPEKTAEVEKLKMFLQKAFSCSLELTDEIHRMRFSRGQMRVPCAHFPASLNDVEPKMTDLVRRAFEKQIDKVKFTISAYNVCTSESSAFNDKMVDTAAAVIQKEAIVTVLSHFQEEAKGQSNIPSDGGLWGSTEGGMELYETYSFLPRLVDSARDNVNISADLLSRLLSHDEAHHMVASLLHAGGFRFMGSKRLDEMLLSEGAAIKSLDVLVSNAQFGDALAILLAKETKEAVENSLGNYFQKKTALSVLLSVSTIPESSTGRQNFQPSDAAVQPFHSLRSYPRLTSDDVRTAQAMIQKGIHELQSLVYKALKRVVTNKSSREAGLSWLAALISLNQLRTSSVMQDTSGVQPVCSDGFMLNLCSTLLEFFLPISQNLDKLNKVDLGYSASPACRLTYHFESCLAGGQIVAEKGKERQLGELPTELQGTHSFITECFHLTQRALSVTVIPAIKHYNKMHSHFNNMQAHMKGSPDKEESIKNQHVLVSVVWETCLLDTDLARGVTSFYISQARLLLDAVNSLQEKHKDAEEARQAQQKALAVIPEFCIKDMAQWFSFLAFTLLRVHPDAVKGITLTPFVDCCVMLLERTDLMPGPVPASMIVSALLTFMKDSENDARFSGRSGWGSGIMSDLAAMVHTCPSAQTKLGPALLRTYVDVDTVVGLDVDRDTFDQFSSRVQIGQLMQKLWSRTDCRASIINQCGTELFQNFLKSILDTLQYMFHDSLSRLANVKKVETLKANEDEWKALSPREKAEKEQFLRNEEHVGSGFMRQAKKTLKLLTLVTQSDKVVQCFTRQPLATRAASTMNGFLDSLCGSKAKSFKVKDMSKYDFSPVELLDTIVSLILRIVEMDVSRDDGYLVSMVMDPDFELPNMEKAQSVLMDKTLADADQVSQLLEQLQLLAAKHNPQASSGRGEEDEEGGSWRDAFLEQDIDQGALDTQYTSAMTDLRFSQASRVMDPHCFQGMMQAGLEARSPVVKTLMKEMKQLTTSLPVSSGASIYVRQDKERLDVMRALVTGPTGTPYSLGCFCFDIYFPSSYPNVPPLVKIITTGNGTVRFNPNLYADGKVCLSLLGTWHAGDASEKWTPGQSSIYQVLVSIQSMILTPDPVFNEPGYEAIKGTEEGEVQSRQYNWKLQMQTLRHAVLGQLKKPPTGFEGVIRRHFALQREAVLKQCAQWVKGCDDPDVLRRLRQAADAIFEELMSLEVDFEQEEEDSDEELD